jgi:hypothetical protein
MPDYARLVRNATALAPRMEFALRQKYWRVPTEEIRIAVDGALISYCNSARPETLENEEPWGYMWNAAERLIQKYLLHHKREAPMGEERYEYDAMDQAAHDFNIHETLNIILPLIKNKNYIEMLELHYLKELSFDEIAEMQGRKVKTVHRCHERALGKAQFIAWRLGLCPPCKDHAKTEKK